MKQNAILLRRKSRLVVNIINPDNQNSEPKNTNYVEAIEADIVKLGYIFDAELKESLAQLPLTDLAPFYAWILDTLNKFLGNHVAHVPLFRKFPEGIPENTFQLYIKRVNEFIKGELGTLDNVKILSCGHAVNKDNWDWTNYAGCPICNRRIDLNDVEDTTPKAALEDITPFRIISLGKEEELFELVQNLFKSPTSISQQDKEDIDSLFGIYQAQLIEHLPTQIPLKENIALLAKSAVLHCHEQANELMNTHVDTATDVLRILTALSDGDLSLKVPVKFQKLKRKERRFFLKLLNDLGKKITADMLKYKKRWIRLGEILHPGEYKKRFPIAFGAFQILRNNHKFQTFHGKLETALEQGKIQEAVQLVKARPGEFARRLDYLLRSAPELIDSTIVTFEEVVSELPTPMLMQLSSHFENRMQKQPIRAFFPKGEVAAVKVLDDDRATLDELDCDKLLDIIYTTLLDRFAKKAPLDLVTIDSRLDNYLIPFSQRSASKAFKTIPRGSKIPLPSTTIRMFVHWMEATTDSNCIDIDLSAVLYDKDWGYKEHLSYTNLAAFGCYHSGDLTSAPPPLGASEFIDINVAKMLEAGVRYVVMNLYSYSQEPYSEVPVCFAGIMERKKPKSGEAFEPRTVQQKFDLTADTKIAIPLILDLAELQLIWCDIALSTGAKFNNVESNFGNMTLMGKAMVSVFNYRPTLFKLAALHAAARAPYIKVDQQVFEAAQHPLRTFFQLMYRKLKTVEVDISSDQQLHFSAEDIVEDSTYTPFAVDKIVGELLD
ncbi:MAG: hypothetical protein GY810_13755 [Aureispira sp.]|nr:hypothetical protein [Aureispira sp.]